MPEITAILVAMLPLFTPPASFDPAIGWTAAPAYTVSHPYGPKHSAVNAGTKWAFAAHNVTERTPK